MSHYLEPNVVMASTAITRRRELPDGVIGEILVKPGSRVNASTVVARGTRPTDYKIYDIAAALGLAPDDEALEDIIHLMPGDTVEKGDFLAKVPRRKRRRIPRAPSDAVVKLTDHGRVILELQPEEVEVLARLEGTVEAVDAGRSVTIAAQGAVMRCAWGNGQVASTIFAFEPGFEYGSSKTSKTSGLAQLMGQDVTLSSYRSKVIVLMRMLTSLDLDVIVNQEMGGIVAPSAPVHLREKAMQLKVPVILTEGFGNLPPSSRIYDILLERSNNAAIFDAALPDHHGNIHPEIIIPRMAREGRPSIDATVPAAVGMRVRMRRAPYAGRIGEIVGLPELPVVVESGLSVQCARVRLQTGDTVTVPLANLANLGEGPE